MLYLGNSSSSESSTSEDEIDNCQALTDIARGCTASAIAGDFFGDGELSGTRIGSLCLNGNKCLAFHKFYEYCLEIFLK